MRPRGVGILVAVMVLSTVAFGIGAGLEKSTAATNASGVHQESVGTAESGGSGESGASTGKVPSNSETVLGINPESTPIIVAALLGSALLLLGVWLYWRRSTVLWAAGAAMAAFAVVDLVEVVHQVSEQHPTLVVVAGIVAVLHGTGTVMAVRLATAGIPTVRQPAA